MPLSYRLIPRETALNTKLIVTDIDGTITDGKGELSIAAFQSINRAKTAGINIGLASGRAICSLDALARYIGISGPLVAENGGVGRPHPGSPLMDFGNSKAKAEEAMNRLTSVYGTRIQQPDDKSCRHVDIAIKRKGITVEDISKVVSDVQILDSGFMIHILNPGINKGDTLLNLISHSKVVLAKEEILVLGDSPTDISLFQFFPNSVLIDNRYPVSTEMEDILKTARYISESSYGEGFAEVVNFVLDLRAR